MTLSTIEVRDRAEEYTAVVRQRITMQETERIPGWLGTTYTSIQRAGLQPAGMPFVRTLAIDAEGMEIEVGWPVPTPFGEDGDVHGATLPGGRVAVASYFGQYEAIGPRGTTS